jgi:DNA-binding FadR family transcriptional regulator
MASIPGDFFGMALRRDSDALLELLEVRRALEVHNSAPRRGPCDRGRFEGHARETIDTMTAKSKAKADDPIGFDDAEFHQRLAAASGNRLGASQLLTRRVWRNEHGIQ